MYFSFFFPLESGSDKMRQKQRPLGKSCGEGDDWVEYGWDRAAGGRILVLKAGMRKHERKRSLGIDTSKISTF